MLKVNENAIEIEELTPSSDIELPTAEPVEEVKLQRHPLDRKNKAELIEMIEVRSRRIEELEAILHNQASPDVTRVIEENRRLREYADMTNQENQSLTHSLANANTLLNEAHENHINLLSVIQSAIAMSEKNLRRNMLDKENGGRK